MMTERIGYIGLGIMGRGMARNLLKAGLPVTVWNRTASRMDELVAEGATAGKSPADVAAECDIIITCVSDTPDVEAVILGAQGVIHGAKSGALVIDMSTISPQATQAIAAQLAEKGVHMLDAPV
jgi:3-hydroxyisobutyrate dehydrogenase